MISATSFSDVTILMIKESFNLIAHEYIGQELENK